MTAGTFLQREVQRAASRQDEAGGAPLLARSPPPKEAAGSPGGVADKLIGLVLVLTASLSAGFRWACTQLLMAPRRYGEIAVYL